MADLQEQILLILNEKGSLNSEELGKELQVDHQRIVGAIKSLETLPEVRFFIMAFK